MPPVRVRAWFRVRVSFRVGGRQFPSGANVLEPFFLYFKSKSAQMFDVKVARVVNLNLAFTE